VKVALVVDNPLRDLPGLTLIAWNLSRKGYKIFLIPMYGLTSEIWRLRPQYILINYLRENNQHVVKRMIAAGFRVGILETEGGIFSLIPKGVKKDNGESDKDAETEISAFEEYALTMASDASIRSKIEVLCAWSKPFADYAVKRGWYTSDQIAITGTPRIDFYAEKWRSLSLSIGKGHYVEKNSKTILINGSFPLANPSYQTPEQEVEMMIQRFGYDRDYVERWAKVQKNGMVGMVEVANILASEFPEILFVYRPHPFESTAYYETHLKKSKNLKLIKEGTVDGWLLRSIAMVHSGSSTAQEAGMVGIPALTPKWLPTHLPIPMQDSVSVWCENKQELLSIVKKIAEEDYEIPKKVIEALNKSITQTFYKIDGNCHKRICSTVVRALHRSNSKSFKETCIYFLSGVFPPAGYFWRNYLRRIIQNWTQSASISQNKKKKWFSKEDISPYIDFLNQTKSENQNYTKIRKSGTSLCLFVKNSL
jgi:surface carbohydrate biosynthesis protein